MTVRVKMPVRVAVRLGGIGLGLAAAATLVACGSSGPAAAPVSQETGIQAYLTCLSNNGVTLPNTGRSPGANGSARPSFGGRPSTRPSGAPSARPSGSPGGRGGFGGFGGGGGFFGTAAPPGVDQATWDKATKACASVRPTAGPSGGAGGVSSAVRAYRNCLTEHGVPATTAAGQLNPADPTVATAMAACAVLRPTAAPTPTPTG